MIRNVERAALLGVLHHRAGIVRRDDRETAVADGPKRELPGIGHGAGVERRDLIVVLIGAAEKRGRELVLDLLHERSVDAGGFEPGAIVAEVLSGGAHQTRPLAEQRERVGDVGRAAPAPLVVALRAVVLVVSCVVLPIPVTAVAVRLPVLISVPAPLP